MSMHYVDPSTVCAPVARADPSIPIVARPSHERQGYYRASGKRYLDVFLCLVLLPFAVPIILFLAGVILLTGHPPFFIQNRIGRHGQIFRMWKLRSMIRDSDEMLETYLAKDRTARLEWRDAQKLRCDPRVTPFGSFLRRTSLDELPQLWNVLRGDMSLVGPRPMLITQQPLYHGRDYYSLRPGISGNWQVSSRNESRFSDRAAFDTSYNQNLCLLNDLNILKDTFGAVLRATGR